MATVVLANAGPVHPGATLMAAWDGVETPTPDDWIGLFPSGDPGTGRISFGFTGGGRSGSMALALPDSTAPGSYELRLFPHNTWNPVARETFPVVAQGSGAGGGAGGGGGGSGGGAGSDGGAGDATPGAGGLDLQAILKNPLVLGAGALLLANQFGLFGGHGRRH